MIRVHRALTVAGTGGILLAFVPFAYDYLPTDAFTGDALWPQVWMVLPCLLLPYAIAVSCVLWFRWGSLPRWCSPAGYGLATILGAMFQVQAFLGGGVSGFWDLAYVAAGVFAFIGCLGFAHWGVKRRPDLRGLIAMQAVYIIQMELFFALAIGDYQIGAWLGTIAAFSYMAQIALIAERKAALLFVVGCATMFAVNFSAAV